MAGAPTPIHSLRRRVQVLERELLYTRKQMEVLVRRSPAVTNNKAEVFLAKTAEDSSYPAAPANVFGIIFCTVSFTRAEGDQSPTYTDHSASVQDFAFSPWGYVPEGTYVLVRRQRNGQYVIISPVGLHWIEFELTEVLTTADADCTADVVDGFGGDLPATGTGVTLLNLETSSAGTYVFAGASGAKGLAFHKGGTTYQIFQLEC